MQGEQRYLERDPGNAIIGEFTLPIRFQLLELERFGALSGECGLVLTDFFGDYDESPYDARNSRFMIAELAAASG